MITREDAEEIAAGFARWIARQDAPAEPGPDARIAALEAEVRDLRRDLGRARRAISRARAALEGVAD
jgi:hypothetical protein